MDSLYYFKDVNVFLKKAFINQSNIIRCVFEYKNILIDVHVPKTLTKDNVVFDIIPRLSSNDEIISELEDIIKEDKFWNEFTQVIGLLIYIKNNQKDNLIDLLNDNDGEYSNK